MRGLRTALATLTVVPVGRFEPDAPGAVAWYPWIGWLFGGVAYAVARAYASLPPSDASGPKTALASALVALVIVASWAAMSRLLHWDGLADTFDGVLGGHTPERRLEIMRDSHIGAFGVTAIAIGVFAEVIAIAMILEAGGVWAVLAAPVAGRGMAALTVMAAAPARADGLGASASGRSARKALWVVVALVPIGLTLQTSGSAALAGTLLALALLASAAVARALTRCVHGHTGDILGAVVILTEIAVLLAGVGSGSVAARPDFLA